jgi:FtsH-binding integral membrane protein
MITHQNKFYQTDSQSFDQASVVRTFMTSVFSWMFLALAVTAVTAYLFASDASLTQMLFNAETGSLNLLGWIVTLAPFGFVMLIYGGVGRFSFGILSLLLMVFSILMGMSLSFILHVYTGSSIFLTFAVTAGTFGTMAFMGYTTKTDLSKFGSLMMMGLVGIIIASIANFFMRSSSLDYIISFIGVLVFTGLTAYDVQKLKRIAAGQQYGQLPLNKLVILGALNLYLDFINLFLFLLRFLGARK